MDGSLGTISRESPKKGHVFVIGNENQYPKWGGGVCGGLGTSI